jgi:hypothetical protein
VQSTHVGHRGRDFRRLVNALIGAWARDNLHGKTCR